MNKLDFKSIGVQELDANEMIEIEGGSAANWLKLAGAVISLVIAIIALVD